MDGSVAMQADFILDYDLVTVEQPHKLYLMARLSSGPAPQDQRRSPINVSLVIDRSGSMAGEKLDYTRQAAQFLVQNLSSQDILSIVLYNDKVETLIPPERVQRKDAINHRIDSIKASATTNLSGGWLEGCNLVAQNLDEKRVNRVILMSDGLANRGITDTGRLVALAQQKLAEGVSTTTMGLGRDFNEDLMMAIANAGGGAFYFIESPEVTPTIFHEELHGLLSVVGQNLIVSVESMSHVTHVHQLNAYPVSSDGQRVSFRLGDVFGDEVKTLILELTIPALHDIGEKQIATLRFEYDELSEGVTQHRVWEMPVRINVAPQGTQIPQLGNPELTRNVLLLKAAQARSEAVQFADRGQFTNAAKILREAADALAAEANHDQRLAEEREALLRQANDVERGASGYDEYSRKTMSTQAFYTMMDRHESTQVLRMRERERQTQEQPSVSSEPVSVPEGTTGGAARKPGVTPSKVLWGAQTIPLQGSLLRIGRAQHNEIHIVRPGISRFHAQIRREGDKWMIEDLGSTNGTQVNGKDLEKTAHTLSVGDEVTISDEKLVFLE
jgi:Ca-activated chloride channel homolog